MERTTSLSHYEDFKEEEIKQARPGITRQGSLPSNLDAADDTLVDTHSLEILREHITSSQRSLTGASFFRRSSFPGPDPRAGSQAGSQGRSPGQDPRVGSQGPTPEQDSRTESQGRIPVRNPRVDPRARFQSLTPEQDPRAVPQGRLQGPISRA